MEEPDEFREGSGKVLLEEPDELCRSGACGGRPSPKDPCEGEEEEAEGCRSGSGTRGELEA